MKKTLNVVFIVIILFCSCTTTGSNISSLDFSEPEIYLDNNINDTKIVGLFNSFSSTPDVFYDDRDESIVYYVFSNEGISFCFRNDYLYAIVFNIANTENNNYLEYQLPYDIEEITNKKDVYKKINFYPLYASISGESEMDAYFFPSYNLIFSYMDEKIEQIIINSLYIDQLNNDLNFDEIFLSLSDMKQIFSDMDNVQKIGDTDIDDNQKIWELTDNKSVSYLLLGIYTFDNGIDADEYLNGVLKEAAIQIGEEELRVNNNPFLESLNYNLFMGENDYGTSYISHYNAQFQNIVFSIDASCPKDLGYDYCIDILYSTMFYQMQSIISNYNL